MLKDSAINSALMPSEHIEWQAAPVWSEAARPPSRWLAILRMLALALLASVIAIVVIYAGGDAEPKSLARSVSAAAIMISGALTIYFWIKTAGRVFALFERPDLRPDACYVLTDRRLLVIRGDAGETQTVTSANNLLEATLKPNGRVHDLHLWFGPRGNDECYDYGDPLVLFALENGAEAKKKMIERFGPPSWR